MTKLVVMGAINWDVNFFVDEFPKIGEEVPVLEITRVPGGKGANASVAAARILGPNEVALIGGLGKDEIGKRQLSILTEEGLVISGMKLCEKVESGQAYIVIDKRGRNVIHTYFGANLELRPEDFEDEIRKRIVEDSQIIVIIEPPFEAIDTITARAEELGKIVIWDTGVRSKIGFKALERILQRIDYLLLNEVEYENLFGTVFSWDAAWTLPIPSERLKVVVKLGERGAALVSRKRKNRVEGIKLEELGLKVVNTVGCGDAFLGALASYKSLGYSDEESLRMANFAGAFKATRAETRGSPTKKELEELARKVEG